MAGQRFGRVIGREGTQVAILALAALLGQGAAGMSGRLQLMPSFARAAALGEVQAGFQLAAAHEVSAVAVAQGTLVVSLPATAVAMSAKGDGTHDHHIATIRNEISTARGGPWTPRFRDLFKRAGMTLDDVENIVPILGHKGPHPERYHQIVYKRLIEATRHCGGVAECRPALERALKRLAREIETSGTELNLLVTRKAPR
ncbi:MAG TPA: AHH domain-containing protein [Myxococcus sp.]|nr:AHH domain-containing protein [Myxococcus sp.]